MEIISCYKVYLRIFVEIISYFKRYLRIYVEITRISCFKWSLAKKIVFSLCGFVKVANGSYLIVFLIIILNEILFKAYRIGYFTKNI